MKTDCQVIALKFWGNVHYEMPATWLRDDPDASVLHIPAGSPITHYTRAFSYLAETPSDVWFWRDRYYNVFINHHPDGSLDNFYCNVSMPPLITTSNIRWVDLDLDVKILADGTARILDEDEFLRHSVQYGYPQNVIASARQAVDQILDLARQGQGPFDRLQHDVRVVP